MGSSFLKMERQLISPGGSMLSRMGVNGERRILQLLLALQAKPVVLILSMPIHMKKQLNLSEDMFLPGK